MKNAVPAITRLHIWLQRFIRWEFWPWRVVYLPVAVYWFFLAVRAKGWVFFSAANPCMRFGGLLGYSKTKVHQLVPDNYLPKTIYLDGGLISSDTVLEQIKASGISFPLIVKPDVGERGRGVKIVKTEQDLAQALTDKSGKLLVQQYEDLPIELGVMYSRHPDEEIGKITSIVVKEFPTVIGDGSKTLLQLILANLRTRLSYKVHLKRFAHRLNEIPAKGEQVQIVHIGNHMLGTTLFNGNHLIDTEIELVFDELAKQINGFFVGRFDVKVASIDALKKGEFKVIEVNGVNSEPCHIFHPDRSVFLAWRDLFKHWNRIADISIANHKKGISYAPFSEIRAAIKQHNQQVALAE